MTLTDKVLYHQVHPAKLAADFGSAAVSLYFFWQHELMLGLVTHLAPPIAASVFLLRYRTFEDYERSAVGRSLKCYMTRVMEALRFAGDVIMVLGAWLHRPLVIALGLAIILAVWASVMLRGRTAG